MFKASCTFFLICVLSVVLQSDTLKWKKKLWLCSVPLPSIVFCSAVISITTVPSAAVSDVPQVCCCCCHCRCCCCLPLPTLPDQLPTYPTPPPPPPPLACLFAAVAAATTGHTLLTTAKTTHCCFTNSPPLLSSFSPHPKSIFLSALFYPFLFLSLHMYPSSSPPALLQRPHPPLHPGQWTLFLF